MDIKKYNCQNDYNRIIQFLRECYFENKNITTWLPARFEDLVYRVDTLYSVERRRPSFLDFIYIWEDNGNIIGVILPDSGTVYMNIKKGYEFIFPQMIDFAEQHLESLFKKNDNGKINFTITANDSQKYKIEELINRGYIRQEDFEYDNCQNPIDNKLEIILPPGFIQVYGNEIDDDYKKAKCCHLGFHPENEANDFFKEGMEAYKTRKNAPMFKDSFESLVITEDKNICSYSFCYVDKLSNIAYIEPVCTREKYRRKGIGQAMLIGIIKKLKEMKIERCCVGCAGDWRQKFYHSAGFEIQDSISYWTREI